MELSSLVRAASTLPARIFGLYPRKGTIQPGSDADLVVYDPEYRGVISARTQQISCDYNPYEGVAIRGRPSTVIVRGEIAAQDGRFTGDPGRGRFLPRRARG